MTPRRDASDLLDLIPPESAYRRGSEAAETGQKKAM